MISGLVSVIIPTYNREAFLQEAVDSCMKQTYPQVEAIIIDDGSTDGTAKAVEELLSRWGSEKIRYLYQTNQGVSAARNAGLAMARGEYIQFLDSDDYLDVKKFAVQVEALSKSPHPVAISDFCFVNESGQIIKLQTGNRDVRKLLSTLGFLNISVSLIRADSIAYNLRFNTNMRRYEDADFMFRYFLRVTHWEYSPGTLVFYRQHEGERLNRFGDVDKPIKEYQDFFESIYLDWKKNKASIPHTNRWMVRESAKKVAARLYAGHDFYHSWRVAFWGILPPFEIHRGLICLEIFIKAFIRSSEVNFRSFLETKKGVQ